jgi:predicted RNA-binding Zn-ribbon protein involved in translation (DUF1610 family)
MPIRRNATRILTRFFESPDLFDENSQIDDSAYPGRIDELQKEVMWIGVAAIQPGKRSGSLRLLEMAEANPMICPDCGVPMNHHADKVRKETRPDDARAFDSGLGGVIEEFHTCPQCGKTESRRAPHSETS